MSQTIFRFVRTCLLIGLVNIGFCFGQVDQRWGRLSYSPSQLDSLKRSISGPSLPNQDQVQQLMFLSRGYLSFAPDTALKYAKMGLNLTGQASPTAEAPVFHLTIGDVMASYGGYARAADHYFQALDVFRAYEDMQGVAYTHNALGDMYYYTRQLSESLQEHQKALDIARKENLTELEGMTLGYIGHFYEKQGDYDQALTYQQLALEKYKDLQDNAGLSTIYGNLGSIYEDLERYDQAFEYFSLALTYNLKTPNKEERLVHLNNLGDVYRKRNILPEALSYTRESLHLSQKLENLYQEKSAQRDLARTFALMGQFDSAYFYLEAAYELHEALYNAEGASQIARMQSLNDIAEAQKEVEILKRDRRLTQITWTFVVVGLSLLLVMYALVVSRQRLKSRKDKELLEAKQQLMEQALENSQLRAQQLQSDLEVSSSQLSTHAISIVQKNKMLKDIQTRLRHLKTQDKSLQTPIGQLLKKIDESFHFDKDWEKFKHIFEQVHPQFFRKLRETYPDLTPAEIRLCALLRLNLDSKDMATILGISTDSLRVARYRLRKKLGVNRGVNLSVFVNHL